MSNIGLSQTIKAKKSIKKSKNVEGIKKNWQVVYNTSGQEVLPGNFGEDLSDIDLNALSGSGSNSMTGDNGRELEMIENSIGSSYDASIKNRGSVGRGSVELMPGDYGDESPIGESGSGSGISFESGDGSSGSGSTSNEAMVHQLLNSVVENTDESGAYESGASSENTNSDYMKTNISNEMMDKNNVLSEKETKGKLSNQTKSDEKPQTADNKAASLRPPVIANPAQIKPVLLHAVPATNVSQSSNTPIRTGKLVNQSQSASLSVTAGTKSFTKSSSTAAEEQAQALLQSLGEGSGSGMEDYYSGLDETESGLESGSSLSGVAGAILSSDEEGKVSGEAIHPKSSQTRIESVSDNILPSTVEGELISPKQHFHQNVSTVGTFKADVKPVSIENENGDTANYLIAENSDLSESGTSGESATESGSGTQENDNGTQESDSITLEADNFGLPSKAQSNRDEDSLKSIQEALNNEEENSEVTSAKHKEKNGEKGTFISELSQRNIQSSCQDVLPKLISTHFSPMSHFCIS